MKLTGIAAVVTGGGSGLGAATVRALTEAGARVTVLDIDNAAAELVAAENDGLGLGCDVTSADGAAAAMIEAAKHHGPARVLVNCAGIAAGQKILGRDGVMQLDAFRKVVEVNLTGSFNMLRLFVEAASELSPLTDGERGVVVNTASVAAFEGQIGQIAYAASKGGVAAMTLPAARELAPLGIRVCTIAPGIFDSPMLRGLPAHVQESLGKSVPFPSRLGQPKEYSALALHIVANRMLNGETIRLDGALRLAPQ